MTIPLVETLEKAVESILPGSPVTQAVEAVAATVVAPTPEQILADIELAISLAKQLKTLAGSHPTLASIVKALF